MKQNLSKVLLAALVIPTFIAGATASHADEENSSSVEYKESLDAQDAYERAYEEIYAETKEEVVATEDLDTVKEDAKKELKENGVESNFFLKEVDKAKTKEGVESLKDELLESHKNSKKENKKEEDKKDEKKSIPLTKIENIAKSNKKTSKENNEVGFSSKEKAEKAAKKALENDKINKTFTISEKDGKFFYVLSPAEDLSNVKEKEENKKEEKKETENKEQSKPARRSNDNVKTGVGSLTGVSMTLITAAAALKKTKKK